MASRKRRRVGALNRSILALLKRKRQPLSGHAIAREFGAAGDHIFSSQAFRSLHELSDQGEIHRVELINSYIVGPPCTSMNLICDSCGLLTSIAAPAIFDELQALGQRTGMRTRRLIVESTGLCKTCREFAGTSERSASRR